MSRRRVIFFLLISGLSCLWCAFVFMAQGVRFQHRELIYAIREGDEAPTPRALAQAIANYRYVMRWVPCDAVLHEDLALLLAQNADNAVDLMDVAAEDKAFAWMDEALGAQLACNPRDGKAWLDLATITTYREGLSKRAANAYQISQKVTPQESWLSEKRLMFALPFSPLFDEASLATAQRDLATLEHAHPNHLTAVQKEAQLSSKEALYARFSAARQ